MILWSVDIENSDKVRNLAQTLQFFEIDLSHSILIIIGPVRFC